MDGTTTWTAAPTQPGPPARPPHAEGPITAATVRANVAYASLPTSSPGNGSLIGYPSAASTRTNVRPPRAAADGGRSRHELLQ